MIEHLNTLPKFSERVLILGGSGFIGQNIIEKLSYKTENIVSLGSKNLDLTAPDSIDKLKNIFNKSDTVIFLSAITPDKGKNIATFTKNILMMKHFIDAIKISPVGHIIYLSSDAVYGLDQSYISEESPVAPESLYGVMHLSREIMLSEVHEIPHIILRVTMVYGKGDSHFAYGPNRFYNSAINNNTIEIFGNGEEYRDYIHIDDLVNIIEKIIYLKSVGLINIASGVSITFNEIANIIINNISDTIEKVKNKRINKIKHKHFNITKLIKAFPSISIRSMEIGITEYSK
jgi:UDP-glucose 4-epimerase